MNGLSVCHASLVYAISMRFCFFPNNIGISQIIYSCTLLITKLCTISLLLLPMCLTLINANISMIMTFTTTVIFGQIILGPMDHICLEYYLSLVIYIFICHFTPCQILCSLRCTLSLLTPDKMNIKIYSF